MVSPPLAWLSPEGDPRLGRRFQRAISRFEGPELRLLGRVDALIDVKGRKVNPAEIQRRCSSSRVSRKLSSSASQTQSVAAKWCVL